MHTLINMEVCYCGERAWYVCKPCKHFLCEKHKEKHQKISYRKHRIEELGVTLPPEQISQVTKDFLKKVKVLQECKNYIMSKTEILVAKINNNSTQALKLIKEKQQAYSNLLFDIRNKVSEEQLKEIKRLSLISLELITPPHDFIEIDKFYASDFVKEVIYRTSNSSKIRIQEELADLERGYGDVNICDGPIYESDLHNCTQSMIESLKSKLEQEQRAIKELESSSAKQINRLEEERAVLAEKLIIMEAKNADMESRLKQGIEQLQQQLMNKKESDSTEKMIVQLENERLKTLMQESEKELDEKSASYDRERLLWENKHNFLIQQREQAKIDLSEAQKEFEAHLEQVQKRGISEQEELEGATNSLIALMEARNTERIKDMQESHQNQVVELSDRLKISNNELRTIRERFKLERRGRNMDSYRLEKRVQDLLKDEGKLIEEIEKVKEDCDRKIDEFQEEFMIENEQLKANLSKYEKRVKDAEFMRCQQCLEKESVKCSLERDHFMGKHNEDEEMLMRPEMRKEPLLRENEKLRNENGSRRPSAGSFITKPESTQAPKQTVDEILKNCGMSFEEFSRENDSKNVIARYTPISSHGEVSLMPSQKIGFSPIPDNKINRSICPLKFVKNT